MTLVCLALVSILDGLDGVHEAEPRFYVDIIFSVTSGFRLLFSSVEFYELLVRCADVLVFFLSFAHWGGHIPYFRHVWIR